MVGVVARTPQLPAASPTHDLAPAALQLVELVEDWLVSKRPRRQREDGATRSVNSDRARRGDLCRWGRLICFVRGRDHLPFGANASIVDDIGGCTLADFDVETLQRALTAADTAYAPATLRRMTSTLRSFTRWCNARGHLRIDPCADEVFDLPAAAPSRPKSLETNEVDALLAAAAAPPPPGSRGLRWPERDVAVIELAAGCGLRAEEVVRAELGWVDRRTDPPVLRVIGKGGKSRDVPVPYRVLAALDAWLAVRAEVATDSPRSPLLCRGDGTALSTFTLDRLVRALAATAGVTLPAGAATHSLRHHYGTTLALRGVHLSFIAQLLGHADPKTSQIYTTVASTQLIAVLDDAGML
jgi:site-specific recombinase XerD